MNRSSDDQPEPKSGAFDPRSIMRSIERSMAAKSDTPSAQAQELYYDAMDAPSAAKRLKLLEKALELDPGNVDVLLALLPHEPFALGEEIECLQQLVQLAAQRLGPDAFQELKGAFWGFHETRPYMRARARLAEVLRHAGRHEEAIAEWTAMLELNPHDNQGLRYLLLPALLRLNRVEAARTLIAAYSGEVPYSAVFAWGHVLERFLSDDAPGAVTALAVARKQNPHVQGYIKGHKEIPKTTPAAYAPGSKDEAICFAGVLRSAWEKHPAALAWLTAQPVK
jgi:tetratricopeptide (TPR) repeat protein